MTFESAASGEFFLLGRLLVGATLAFMGLNHFLDVENMAGYAGTKGVPAPSLAVVASGSMLVGGGFGVAAGAFPVLAAGALVTFFVVVTPVMHDFWTVEDPEARQNEQIDFLKNVGLLGASLVFLALGAEAWPYAVDVGLF